MLNKEILLKHLDDAKARKGRFERVLAMAGAGAPYSTYKSAEELRSVARDIPEDRLLVETDAPYLAPVPHRGKTNEPAFVVRTLEKLAEVRGTTPDAMARTTNDNFFRLFTKVPRPARQALVASASKGPPMAMESHLGKLAREPARRPGRAPSRSSAASCLARRSP